MIHTVWPYLAIMLLAAGIFPVLRRRGWRFSRAVFHRAWPSAFAAFATRDSRSPLPARILLALPRYILVAGFGMPLTSVSSTLAPV